MNTLKPYENLYEGTFKKTIKTELTYNFLVSLPDGYSDKGTPWPVMLFLHGAGERGNDLNLVKIHGPLKLVENGKKLPFIIIAPQCPEGSYWSSVSLNALLDHVIDNFNADPNRLYATGLSMGGYGTWWLAIDYPGRLAAIAPVCGAAVPFMAYTIKHVPVWAFHGEEDTVVPFITDKLMVDALKEVGGNVKFTVYPGVKHNSWDNAYGTGELYEWLLQHSLNK